MHLKQLGVTYSACAPFTKNKELDKACFQQNMAHGDFKDLPKRTLADKALRDKASDITKNPKLDGYQHGLPSIVHTFFDKKNFWWCC